MKLKYAKKEDIPDGMEAFYVEKDGEYIHKEALDMIPKGKLDEFRQNNVDLNKNIATLTEEMEKYKDLDPTLYADTLAKLQDMEDKKMIDAGQLEEVLAQRTDRMRQDYEAKMKAATDARDLSDQNAGKYETQLSKLLVETAVAQAVANIGVPKKGAMFDIMSRANAVFKISPEGEIDAFEPDGSTQKYNKAGDKLSIGDWAEELLADTPYLFEPTRGTDAPGGMGKPDGSTIAKDQIDGANLQTDTIEAIATEKLVVV